MKLWKRLTSLILCVVLLLSLLPAGTLRAHGETSIVTYAVEGGIIYFDKSTGTITDCKSYVTSANIPSVIEGVTVTTIGDSAFEYCVLTSVTIPDSVTIIGDRAFYYCDRLASVIIGDSVTTIGDRAFYCCDALISITIPDSVTTIGDSAFRECTALTSVTVGDSVRTVGDFAFCDCYALTSITIPDSVTTISDSVFLDCDSLTSITIPNSVTSIGPNAFYDCDSLTSITIPDSVISIGTGAFSDCDSLTSITIPDSVISIGNVAFSNCDSLTSITIPDSVTAIGNAAFDSCDSLTAIRVNDGNENYSSNQQGDLYNKDKTILIQVPGGRSGKYIILDSVTAIGSFAFAYCSNLTSITIPDSVTSIGNSAFENCYALHDVYYSGSEKQWDYIVIGWLNGNLLSATIHYNDFSESTEPDPTEPEPTEPAPTEPSEKPTEPDQEPTEPEPTEPEPTEPVENPFGDVKEIDYFAQPVLWAVAKGITNGTSATAFSPEKACTRGQIVTFLWRAAGSPEPTKTDSPFSDVKSNAYYYKAVLWAVEEGITTGISARTFGPDKTCTRGQVATFLWRAQGKPTPTSITNPFNDIVKTEYYYTAILWAVEEGVTNGTGEGQFSPNSNCTRGQIVTFLYRAMA